MLLNDFLKLRGQQINVNKPQEAQNLPNTSAAPQINEQGQSFADALKAKLEKTSAIEFSNHAIRRLDSRSVDIDENGKLERLNKGVEIAAEKGSNETLILVDSTAFIVNVRNNKVITTMEMEELKGNVFTNIDSTVIM
ncbi:MAG: hypothetical protein LBC86_01835 [Oscillospiraceae bacterium]|jgi:flagellar operon protein|nr:hypothetical protein [Oscillospiraceae bacterium]